MKPVSKIARCGCILVFVLAALVSWGVNGLVWIQNRLSYQRMIDAAFGAAETHKRISELYQLLESRSIDAELSEPRFDGNELFGYAKTRYVDYKRIARVFDHPDASSTAATTYLGIACYDQNDRFVALQFFSSRTGCFVSRDPRACPLHFDRLTRYTSKDLYITGVDNSTEH